MKTINLLAPIGETGYGQTGKYYAKELNNLLWEVSLFGKGTSKTNDPDLIEMVRRCAVDFDYDAPCLHIWHQNALAESVGRGKYFAFPIFELDTFTEGEKHHLNYPDELIVCSQWAADIVQKEIGRSAKVVPLGYDPMLFYNNIYTTKRGGTYSFINIGKWEVRKGHDILVEIFNKAFTPKDDVELMLMPHNPFLSAGQTAEWVNWYMDSPMGQAGKIKILPPSQTQIGVASNIQWADCGIFPARAEGWNLELLECLASNKPVITTNYSAHTEFCNKQIGNGFLVDIQETEPAFDGKWFFEQGNWAAINDEQVDQFVEHMRYVFKNNIRENPAGPDNVSEFTWAKGAVKLEKVLLDKT